MRKSEMSHRVIAILVNKEENPKTNGRKIENGKSYGKMLHFTTSESQKRKKSRAESQNE